MMNGYEKSHLEEDPFAPSGSVVSAFDAFRTYLKSIHKPRPPGRH